MTKPEIVPAELAEAHQPAEVAPSAPMGLFGVSNPAEVIGAAEATAEALTGILEKRKLYANISGKRHVLVEGWTLLGSMLGVFPVTVWTRKLENGWEARVEAKTQAGAVVGAAEAECLRSETRWASADDYAIRSMAQTRATAKALRLPLGFIVELAGFAATPAEEMPADAGNDDGLRCPSCGSHVWDNLEKRATGWRGPAFRCKSRTCKGTDPETGEIITEGDAGEPWVTWVEHYFDSVGDQLIATLAPGQPLEKALVGLDMKAASADVDGPEYAKVIATARQWLMAQARGNKDIAAQAWTQAQTIHGANDGDQLELVDFLAMVETAGDEAAEAFLEASEPFVDSSYG